MDNSKSIFAIRKRCRVCEDKASGFNFSALSCESCKAFFRRSAFKMELKCENGNNNCEINQVTRRNCMKCRFDKCLAIGMKKQLVSSRLPKSATNQPIKPNNKLVLPLERINLLSNESTLNLKMVELSRLEELYKAALSFPNESSWQIVCEVDQLSQIINLSAVVIKHTIRFIKKVSEFNCLSKEEQVTALKCFLPEINQIRAAFNYNAETKGWAALENSECDKRAVFVKMNFFKSWINVEKYNFSSNLIVDLHREMENDFTIRDLILVQSVFRHRPKIELNREAMQYHNAVFHYLLRRYLEHKYQDTGRAAQKYTSLMALLAKMDTAINSMREFLASPHVVTQVVPVLRAIFNLDQA